MNLENVKKLNIPQSPGCYQFKDESGEIIYIGKAANLRSRVLSYWRKSANHSAAKYSMLKRIRKIDWIEVDSEVEALLLEANLIKKHQPQYNIALRDDKRHVYIKVSTEEKFPRVFMTRKLDKSGRFFGPFVSVEAVQETLKIIRRVWPYRSCKNMPKRACLYFRIGKCPGPCEEKISREDYAKVIKNILLFLEGKKKKVIKNYELRIKNLEKEIKNNDRQELLDELKLIKYQLLNLKKVLGGSNILSLVDKYASDVVELAKVLGLEKVPKRIEGYDISNIYGQAAVGSMVVFEGGEADKSEYKKFKIKIEDSLGDTGMLREVLERRFSHEDWPQPDLIIIDGGKGQLNITLKILKKFNLDILAIAVSKGEGLRSAQAPDKVFFPGEAKPLQLPLASPALHVIKRVRDEAHRFAIKYHKELRKRKIFKK
jgi:excinuclease ABC subunit C